MAYVYNPMPVQMLFYIAVPVAMVLVAIVIYKRIAGGDVARDSSSEDGPADSGSGAVLPVIDLTLCMGSGGCASACPERALSVVRGKAVLSDPALCRGHGACARACPAGAIRLVAKVA